jgi:hypothetical protein
MPEIYNKGTQSITTKIIFKTVMFAPSIY